MARSRTLKPEFWTDSRIVKLSFPARLFYQGMWNFALCDHGHLDDDPDSLKLKILPADPVEPEALIDELVANDRVVRKQTPDGRRYLHVPTLDKHTKMDTRWNTRCPYCAIEGEADPDAPRAASPNLSETHASPDEPAKTQPSKGKESKGREGKVKPSGVPRTRGTRIPDDFAVTPDVERICQHLADQVEANGSKRPTITAAWRTEARLLLDKDGRTVEQILKAIDWCQNDPFWRPNILSMPKLRAKYDQLRLAAQRAPNGRASPAQLVERNGLQLKPETAARVDDRQRFAAMDAAKDTPAIEGPR